MLCTKGPHTLLLFLLIFYGCEEKYQYEFFSYYEMYGARSGVNFVSQYPFDEYLKKYHLEDLKTIEEHRIFLENKKGIGDIFLCRTIEFYVENQEKINAKERALNFIGVGENCLSIVITKNTPHFEIYHVVGYYLLGKAAQILEKKKSRFSDELYNDLRNKLESHRILLSVEEDWWTKLKTRSIGQKIIRIWQEAFPSDDLHTLSLYPGTCHGIIMPETKIFDIYEERDFVGNCIWMNRKEVTCKYLADKDLVSKHTNIRQNNKMLLAASGGFTNDLRQPEGLTFQYGQIINAVLMPDRDGLVIVEETGGIRTCNIKKGFILPHLQKKIHPLSSLSDYIELVQWCRNSHVTAFQTQLLALGDELLISPKKAPKERRERRLLATVSSASGEVEHIIFNFTSGKNLAIVTIEIFEALQKRRKKVEAILNLDVGNFNVLEVYDINGNPIPEVRGTKNVNTATNLLVYSKRN